MMQFYVEPTNISRDESAQTIASGSIRKDGEMKPLSNRLKGLTDDKQPDEKVIIGEYVIELFFDYDIYDIFSYRDFAFSKESYLNIVIFDKSKNAFGIPFSDMAEKNISCITGIWEKNGELWVYHGKGFTSRFSSKDNFKLIAQEFTK